MRTLQSVLAAAISVVLPHVVAGEEEDEAPMLEGIIVEAPFDVRLALPQQSAVEIMIERLNLHAETVRIAELEVANRTAVNTLLGLTKYSPIPLGGSDSRVDTFFMQNHLRPDLNPSKDDPLGLER